VPSTFMRLLTPLALALTASMSLSACASSDGAGAARAASAFERAHLELPADAPATLPATTEPVKRKLRPSGPVTAVPVGLWATAQTMQARLDLCRGPVAIPMGSLPLLVAEHDYCGGKTRFATRRAGDIVAVTGAKDADGTYQVTTTRTVPKGSSTSLLKGMGDIVLQTCVGDTLYLAGAVRI
jgi:hypothetical protein